MGGPEKWQKRGRAKWVLSHFFRHIKESWSFLERSTFKSELFWEIFCVIPPCLFTVHVRLQGFIRPIARVGSGDPVRVLCLYTTNTLDEVCSIYC